MTCLARFSNRSDSVRQIGDVALFLCHLDGDTDHNPGQPTDVLSPAEIARAGRFRFDRDRLRYQRGRAFLRHTLARGTGQDAAALALTEAGNSKPVLSGGPHFNLSHSAGLAVLALCAAGPVGIDLEFIDRQIDIAGLAQTCFTPTETEALLGLAKAEQATRFFAFWTAKEARMKLTGEGMSLPPKAIGLDLRDGWPVGYLKPDTPRAKAIFVDLGIADTLCCLALPL